MLEEPQFTFFIDVKEHDTTSPPRACFIGGHVLIAPTLHKFNS